MTGRVGVSAKERESEREKETDGQVGDGSMIRGNGKRRRKDTSQKTGTNRRVEMPDGDEENV